LRTWWTGGSRATIFTWLTGGTSWTGRARVSVVARTLWWQRLTFAALFRHHVDNVTNGGLLVVNMAPDTVGHVVEFTNIQSDLFVDCLDFRPQYWHPQRACQHRQ
jgi:hypothetical protein